MLKKKLRSVGNLYNIIKNTIKINKKNNKKHKKESTFMMKQLNVER